MIVPQPPTTTKTSSSASVSSRKNSISSLSFADQKQSNNSNSNNRSLKEVSTNSNSNNTVASSFAIPDAAKKAAADYVSFLKSEKEEQHQKQKMTAQISSLHESLRQGLRLSRRGEFDKAVDVCTKATITVAATTPLSSLSSTSSTSTSTTHLQSARYALSLSLPMMLCGCARFEEAKMSIVQAFTFASNETEIEQAEYNLKVVEVLEEKFKKNNKLSHHQIDADELVDLFYTISPAEDENQEQHHQETTTNTEKNSLSTSPPRNAPTTITSIDINKNKNNSESTLAANLPFVNILPSSTSSSITNVVKTKNLIPLSQHNSTNKNTVFPCCSLCLLRSLTFAVVSIQKSTKNIMNSCVKWDSIWVMKETPISEALRKVKSISSCCSIPFHNVLWFERAEHEENEDRKEKQHRDHDNHLSMMNIFTSLTDRLEDSETKKIIRSFLSKHSASFSSTSSIDFTQFLSLLKSKQQHDSKTTVASTTIKMTRKTNSSAKQQQQFPRQRQDPFTMSFLDSFNLFIQPATRLALKEKGTLHIRLSREFLFSGVMHFFSSSIQIPDKSHRSSSSSSVNHNTRNLQHDNDYDDNETIEGAFSSTAAELQHQLLRPLTVSFQAESGVDACLGGLTNDMLQRFCEQFERSWIMQVVEGDVEKAENEFGDFILRSRTFGRVLAKCCLERRRIALKHSRFFCHAAVCGSNEKSWIANRKDDYEDEEEEEEEDDCVELENLQRQAIKMLESSKKPTSMGRNVHTRFLQRQTFSLELPHHHDEVGFMVVTLDSEEENNSKHKNNDDNEILINQTDLEDIALFSSLSKPTSAARSSRASNQEKLRLLLKQHKESLDALRRGFGEFMSNALPPTLSKFLVFDDVLNEENENEDEDTGVDILKLATAMNDDDEEEETEQDDRHQHRIVPSLDNILRSSRLVSSLCFCCDSTCSSLKATANKYKTKIIDCENDEVTGKQVVQVLEFRGWSAKSSQLDDSTPYYLCCWLHYQATPEMRRKFLRFTTCVPNVSPDLSESRIVIQRDPDRLFARTCLRTLHLPSYSTLQELQECLEMAIFVAENIDQEMHE